MTISRHPLHIATRKWSRFHRVTPRHADKHTTSIGWLATASDLLGIATSPPPRKTVGALVSITSAWTVAAWLRERNGQPADPLFPSVRGAALTRDAVERLMSRHAEAAQRRCPSLTRKHVSPHVLRHTAAMELLGHGVDRAVIALWLGHESVDTTPMYLHADLRLKEQALARTAPADVTPGRYRPPDRLLAFLERL